jgi:hypothetical protein
VKGFTKMESRKKERIIRTPLKGEKVVGSYAKEHSALRQGLE